MKLYKVLLLDGREEFVQADTFSEIDDRIVFFRAGQPIPDVFFKLGSVHGVNVDEDPYDASPPPRRRLD